MGISIKHDAYERAIRQLASERRVSLTEAIGQAVMKDLAHTAPEPVFESYLDQVRELQALIATLPVLDDRTADEIIGYDEYGLPS